MVDATRAEATALTAVYAGVGFPSLHDEVTRRLRRELAEEAGVPPYVVFHDSTLREMAQLRPSSLAALGEVGGVGDRKLKAYGDAFLAVIRQH